MSAAPVTSLGDLARLEPEHEPQHQDLPLGKPEPLDEHQQLLVGDPVDRREIGRVGLGLEPAVEIGGCYQLYPAAAAEVADRVVADDHEQPGPERLTAALVIRECLEDLGEDLLRRLLGFVGVLQQDAEVAVDAVEIPEVQEGVGVGVARLDPVDDPRGVLVLGLAIARLEALGEYEALGELTRAAGKLRPADRDERRAPFGDSTPRAGTDAPAIRLARVTPAAASGSARAGSLP